MTSRVTLFIVIILNLLASPVWAADSSRDRFKGLDEQVQAIKGDVLGIAAELNRLEEKLLYPSGTQLSMFVSITKGEKFRLDSVDIQIDGKPVAHHIYSFKELEALRKGGVQRIYLGNMGTGEHQLQVAMGGKSGSGDFRRNATATVKKNVGPKLIEVKLTRPGATHSGIEIRE